MMEGRGGAAINDLIVRDGRRDSVHCSYARPRPNLTILTHALVSKLIYKGTRWLAWRSSWRGSNVNISRSTKSSSLGAINTPKVLKQSGIGPDAELGRHRIPTIEHLPGVGQNHEDHVSFGCIYEYRKTQLIGYGGSEATLYWSSDAR